LDGRIAHAYLFSGPRGTGKTSAARILAKALNCKNPKDGEPCNECENCISITQGRFLDLIEIDAASNRGIEEIRDLKEKVGFLPVEGKYKVYIIDEAHMLTSEAFNALLKTLEEPPENVIFILATTEAYKIPVTILSRTQRFDFKLAEDEDLVNKLAFILKSEELKFDDDALKLISQGATGSFRDAETLLEKAISSLGEEKQLTVKKIEEILGYAGSKIINDFLKRLMDKDSEAAIKIFDEAFSNGVNITQFIKQILENVRKEMLLAIGKGDNAKLKEYMQIVKELNNVVFEVKSSLLPRLNLEMAILNIAGDNDVESKDTKAKTRKIKDEPEKLKPNFKITAEEVRKKWQSIVNESKFYNHNLVALLGTAKVEDFKDDNLLISVPYTYHKDRLCGTETRKFVETIFEKVLGTKVPYTCKVDKTLAAELSQKNNESGNEKLVEEVLK